MTGTICISINDNQIMRELINIYCQKSWKYNFFFNKPNGFYLKFNGNLIYNYDCQKKVCDFFNNSTNPIIEVYYANSIIEGNKNIKMIELEISWGRKVFIFIDKEKTFKELKQIFYYEIGKPDLIDSKEIYCLYNAKPFSELLDKKVEMVEQKIVVMDTKYLLQEKELPKNDNKIIDVFFKEMTGIIINIEIKGIQTIGELIKCYFFKNNYKNDLFNKPNGIYFIFNGNIIYNHDCKKKVCDFFNNSTNPIIDVYEANSITKGNKNIKMITLKLSWGKSVYIFINKEKTFEELKQIFFVNEFGKPELLTSNDIYFIYKAQDYNELFEKKVEIIDATILVTDTKCLLQEKELPKNDNINLNKINNK